MKNVNSFFSSRNTIRELTDSDMQKLTYYLEAIEAFSRTANTSIYIIDYEKKGFEYVSDNPLFLGGHTQQEVKEMGYEFYFKQVPEEDLELLLKINTIGFDFYETIPVEDRKKYTISYDFHLRTEGGKPILIHQKLTPIFLNEKGKIWKAICVVSLSSRQYSGNIMIHKNEGNEIYQYNMEASYWKKLDRIVLSDREKEILRYSIRGFAITEIAEQLFIAPDTVKFHRKKLYEKLEVASISEAISYATAHKLI